MNDFIFYLIYFGNNIANKTLHLKVLNKLFRKHSIIIHKSLLDRKFTKGRHALMIGNTT